MKFYHLSFQEFDVNVFIAILSIQTSYHKINHNSLRMQERRFELILFATTANTGNRFLFSNNRFIKYNLGDTLGLTRL